MKQYHPAWKLKEALKPTQHHSLNRGSLTICYHTELLVLTEYYLPNDYTPTFTALYHSTHLYLPIQLSTAFETDPNIPQC